MAAVASPIAPGSGVRRFGRFELQRVLGEGGQATVWLGFDQRLEREVAVKLMRSGAAADPVAVGEWLREARSVSRLTHPNIVPVFEADVHEEQAYLVFEYVPGPTLAQLMKARGALPANEAVSLMIGVLDALDAAHGAGVVHRDLKPSNVLVGAAGRARVMDFGIAARLNDPNSAELIVGTPGYMSPEATRGGTPTAAMDLFSVGVMLVEALCGARLIAERDPHQAMQRVASEDLQLPEGIASEVDDALRALLRRALEREPVKRWQSAADFRAALQGWLSPAPEDEPGGGARSDGGSANATLDFLLRRMRHKSDFPALSDSVARIQRVANSDSQSLSNLANEILKDVALTNKLLRLVNTAHYSQATGSISTVSRAVALVGFAGIRNMAMSLLLLEHMHDKAHANQLKDEFLRSLLAGMLASELGSMVRESEEAFIGAMFQNLGRLLTEYYFPEEARQVRGIVAGTGKPGSAPVGDATASSRVLGLSFEALGLGVARAWGLPVTLQHCMRKPQGEPPASPPQDAGERMRWLASAANQMADTLMLSDAEHAADHVAAVARRFARTFGVKASIIEGATRVAQRRLAQMVDSMSMQVSAQSPARRLFTTPVVVAESPTLREPRSLAGVGASAPPPSASPPIEASHAVTITMRQAPPRLSTEEACDMLSAGIQDIADTMAGDFKLNDVLRMILETMYRALGFRHVVFCLRDIKTDTLTGRFGLGDGVDAVTAVFRVPLKHENDFFGAVCAKGADVLITDATAAHFSSRLPAWYRKGIDASAFLLLPALVNGVPLALIYADQRAPGTLVLGDTELSRLRTLRNQAVMAFKQAG